MNSAVNSLSSQHNKLPNFSSLGQLAFDLPQQQEHSNNLQPVSGGISELKSLGQGLFLRSIVLPAVAALSQDSHNRWVTCICPRGINRQALRQAGVDTRYLRLIYCNDQNDAMWMTAEALSNGTSDAVIAFFQNELTDVQRMQLDSAAKSGSAQGLLITNTEHQYRAEAA